MSIVTALVNLKLRIKLLLAFGSLLVLSIFLVITFFRTLNNINRYEQAVLQVDAMNIDVLEMKVNMNYFIFEGYKESDFHANGASQYLTSYQKHLSSVRCNLKEIKSALIVSEEAKFDAIGNSLSQLDGQIQELIQLLRERGFKDFGLEGRLRQAIHAVEKSPFNYNKADMLTLRRHEKDFFLRKDLKYQDEFEKKLIEFSQLTATSPQSAERDLILNNLENYKKLFTELITIESQLGLKEDSGLKGKINHQLGGLGNLMSTVRTEIKGINEEFKKGAVIGLLILFAAQLVLGIMLAIVYSNAITRSIKELQRVMHRLSEGFFPSPLIVKSSEEIGKTKTAFNQLLDRMQAAARFAGELGSGNSKTTYDDRFKDDILARAMTKMQAQLEEAHEKQEIINWTNAGSAKLNDLLKNENLEMEIMGDRILKLIINYLNANQGALYSLEEDASGEFLSRISTFAYGRKKYIQERLSLEKCLAGQCVMEQSTIILTNVPADYVKITSGLGEATPGFIVIVPLKTNTKVVGIIEMASFKKMEPHKLLFLEKISENIGAMLNNRKIATTNAHLLEEANKNLQALASKEEELNQNADELSTLREQLERENKHLQNEIAALKSSLKELKREESEKKLIQILNQQLAGQDRQLVNP